MAALNGDVSSPAKRNCSTAGTNSLNRGARPGRPDWPRRKRVPAENPLLQGLDNQQKAVIRSNGGRNVIFLMVSPGARFIDSQAGLLRYGHDGTRLSASRETLAEPRTRIELAEESALRRGLPPVAYFEGRWFGFRFLPLLPGHQTARLIPEG
jgi:hypothetical protein